MDYKKNLVASMSNISLEDEEEGGMALETEELVGNEHLFSRFDAKLCVVVHFISKGQVDYQAMQQTLAALRRQGWVFISKI